MGQRTGSHRNLPISFQLESCGKRDHPPGCGENWGHPRRWTKGGKQVCHCCCFRGQPSACRGGERCAGTGSPVPVPQGRRGRRPRRTRQRRGCRSEGRCPTSTPRSHRRCRAASQTASRQPAGGASRPRTERAGCRWTRRGARAGCCPRRRPATAGGRASFFRTAAVDGRGGEMERWRDGEERWRLRRRRTLGADPLLATTAQSRSDTSGA